jgi:hypothetical protein
VALKDAIGMSFFIWRLNNQEAGTGDAPASSLGRLCLGDHRSDTI